VGGVGVAQAWQWGEGEERAVAPAKSFWRWRGGKWAAALVAEDGRDQLEGRSNGGTGGTATFQERECGQGSAELGPLY
jgi:hypothetical protein